MLEGEETPENTERDTDDPEPAAETDIQMD
jgi:hypothetical protein